MEEKVMRGVVILIILCVLAICVFNLFIKFTSNLALQDNDPEIRKMGKEIKKQQSEIGTSFLRGLFDKPQASGESDVSKSQRNAWEDKGQNYQIEVTGIVAGEKPMAVINGQLLQAGDVFDGLPVKKIGTDHVVLLKNGQDIIVYLEGRNDVDKEAELSAYQERIRRKHQVLQEIKKEREYDAYKNEIKQQEVLEKAKIARMRDAVKEEINRKRSQESSDSFHSRRQQYRPCVMTNEGRLKGTCFPTAEEIKKNYLSPDEYIEEAQAPFR